MDEWLECVSGLLESYVAQHPLTAAELRRGEAVRVVRCVRVHDPALGAKRDEFAWCVLCLSRDEQCSEAPRAAGWGMLASRKVPAMLLGEHAIAVGHVEWHCFEYELRLPYYLRSFNVAWKGSKASCPLRACSQMISECYALMCPADQDADYPAWLESQNRMLRALETPESDIMVSIVTPAYRSNPEFLHEMLRSVLGQTYGVWELVIVNASPDDEQMRAVFDECADPRIIVHDIDENLGISGNTNIGIGLTHGDYVAFLDHDDVLDENAIAEYVRAIEGSGRTADLLYCDEDNIDERGNPSVPLLKPDFDERLLCSQNYIVHWLMVSRRALELTERTGSALDGVQDYDLTWKAAEVARAIVHVPSVLYHWRVHRGSSSHGTTAKLFAADTGLEVIAAHMRRAGVEGRPALGLYPYNFIPVYDLPSRMPNLLCLTHGSQPNAAAEDALGSYERRHGACVSCLSLAEWASFAPELRGGIAFEAVLVVEGGYRFSCEDVEQLVAAFVRTGAAAVYPLVVRGDGLIEAGGYHATEEGTLTPQWHLLNRAAMGYQMAPHHARRTNAVNPNAFLADRGIAVLLSDGLRAFSSEAYACASATMRFAAESGREMLYLPGVVMETTADVTMLPAVCGSDGPDAALLKPQVRQWGLSRSLDDGHGYSKLRRLLK